MVLGSKQAVYRWSPNERVALQLHDVEEPFTSKVALSFYLDNVFANVPAVAVCFHKRGIVQGYHYIKTEELSNVSLRDFPVPVAQSDGDADPTFDPVDVAAKASALLKSLQTNHID